MYSHFEKKNEHLLFFRHNSNENLQILHDDYPAHGLNCRFRFSYIDLLSRSQVCQKHKLQIVFCF